MRGAAPPLPKHTFMEWCLVIYRQLTWRMVNSEPDGLVKLIPMPARWHNPTPAPKPIPILFWHFLMFHLTEMMMI